MTRGVMTLTSGVDCCIRGATFGAADEKCCFAQTSAIATMTTTSPATHHFGGMSLILLQAPPEAAVLVRTSLRGHVITVHGSDLAEFEILFGLRVQAVSLLALSWRHITWHGAAKFSAPQ